MFCASHFDVYLFRYFIIFSIKCISFYYHYVRDCVCLPYISHALSIFLFSLSSICWVERKRKIKGRGREKKEKIKWWVEERGSKKEGRRGVKEKRGWGIRGKDGTKK